MNRFDLIAYTDEYQDSKTGETRSRKVRVGVMFEREDGKRWAKIDAIPISKEWDGSVQVFPANDDRNQNGQ